MKSIRAQLIAAITFVLTLGLGTLLLMAGSQTATKTLQDFVHERQVAVLAVSGSLVEPLEHWAELKTGSDEETALDLQALQRRINADAARLNLAISVLTIDGDMVATTYAVAPPPPIDRPEVQVALNGNMGSEVRNGKLYIAAPVTYQEERLLGFVWAEAPMMPIQAELQGRWLTLIGASLAALVLAWLVGWRLSMRIVRPITAIQSVAEQMAGGRLDVRARVTGTNRELTALGKAFNHMAEEVEAMLAKQREFVANASHELRSPLAALKLRAEALASGTVDGDRARQYAKEIDEETTRLGQLVAELLQLSRLDSQPFIPPTEPINICDELAACAHRLSPRAQARRQQIAVNISETIPEVYIYPHDMHVMVDNLLDNAIKYTHEGGKITLIASWKPNSTLEIEVHDNGEGIPPEDAHRVTERFFRVSRSHNSSIPGTGLGLSLVSVTAQQYGGTLRLESRGIPGQGTRAYLSLRPTFKP
jgi:signal transduction histidine kinase